MSERIGKYLTVRVYPNQHRLTRIWDVIGSDDSRIGEVRWYPSWRQYVFIPDPGIVLNPTCMDDLSRFVRAKHRALLELDIASEAAPDRREPVP